MVKINFVDTVKPKTKLFLQKTANENLAVLNNFEKVDEKLSDETQTFIDLPPILFDYQAEFLEALDDEKWKILVWSKSRRIGATHAIAAHAVISASLSTGKNFFYIGTSLQMAKEFISSCQYWAEHFNFIANQVEESLYESETDQILSLRLNFNSGFKVMALSSKPTSIRGLQGDVLIDEFAFLQNQLEFLKAVKSMLIWGGKVMIVSTHDGIDNEFNLLVESIKKGDEEYYLQETTFKQAIEQGLYRRICLMSGVDWTLEKEFEFVKEIYKQYGHGASEELDCIPSVDSQNSIFDSNWFIKISRNDLPKTFDYQVFAWDFASTEKREDNDPCFTVGIHLGKKNSKYYILGYKYTRSDPKSTQDFVVREIKRMSRGVAIAIELEGGSQSVLWLENSFKPLLKDYRVKAVRPEGDKAIRSLPCAEDCQEGNMYIINESWADDFIKNISRFRGIPGVPLITDTGDSFSLAHTMAKKGLVGLLGT